ncbi:MAG TPA: sulfatase-like hydrolase/transferase [Blastocatellia bacterium]|nr:sulfatase-like hydrolase/transferase [Blastocatellia bacterium]
MRRDLMIAVSLANLCFMKVWGNILAEPGFVVTLPYIPRRYEAYIINVILLASIFLAGITIVRRSGKPWLQKVAKCLFFAVLIIPLNAIRINFTAFSLSFIVGAIGVPTIIFVSIVLCAFLALIVRKHWRSAAYAVQTCILVLFSFAVLTFLQSGWRIIKYSQMKVSANEIDKASKHQQPGTQKRILWVLFDELDQRTTFDARPASINLPELDRFKSESFISSKAYPPAGMTSYSMPALITGRLIAKETPTDPYEMMLRFDGSDIAVRLDQQPTVFSDARNGGLKTGVVGWYQPYCRILGKDINSCFVAGEETDQWRLYQVVVAQWERTFLTIPMAQDLSYDTGLIDHLPRAAFFRQHQVETYNQVMEHARDIVARKDLDFTLIHFPVPHPPGVYDRNTGSMTSERSRSYLDNLALVDRTLGELRRIMESNGTWDDTTVILTADHWWRADTWRAGKVWSPEDESVFKANPDHRVPFMIKLSGRNDAYTYDQQFNTVLLRDLLNAIRTGQVSDTKAIADWLEAHRTIGESPYRGD